VDVVLAMGAEDRKDRAFVEKLHEQLDRIMARGTVTDAAEKPYKICHPYLPPAASSRKYPYPAQPRSPSPDQETRRKARAERKRQKKHSRKFR
jgi:hypothetical protein